MAEASRHLRLVPRRDHFEQGTGTPKISPMHPAWGNTPMEERLKDERVEQPEVKPKLKLVGGSGGKKPPKPPKTKTGGSKEPKEFNTDNQDAVNFINEWNTPPKKTAKKKTTKKPTESPTLFDEN